MLAEQKPVQEYPAAMSRSVAGSPRQATLAEEINEVEKQERVTKALQATVEVHGMKHGIIKSPKGPKPQTNESASVVETPQHTLRRSRPWAPSESMLTKTLGHGNTIASPRKNRRSMRAGNVATNKAQGQWIHVLARSLPIRGAQSRRPKGNQ